LVAKRILIGKPMLGSKLRKWEPLPNNPSKVNELQCQVKDGTIEGLT